MNMLKAREKLPQKKLMHNLFNLSPRTKSPSEYQVDAHPRKRKKENKKYNICIIIYEYVHKILTSVCLQRVAPPPPSQMGHVNLTAETQTPCFQRRCVFPCVSQTSACPCGPVLTGCPPPPSKWIPPALSCRRPPIDTHHVRHISHRWLSRSGSRERRERFSKKHPALCPCAPRDTSVPKASVYVFIP